MQLLQINFEATDQPDVAVQTLRQALLGIGETPIIGLLVKVEKDPQTGRDLIVNWRMADAQVVKLMALTMPFDKRHDGSDDHDAESIQNQELVKSKE